jgi:hypothetical protein
MGENLSASAVATALLDLLDGSNPAAYLQELEERSSPSGWRAVRPELGGGGIGTRSGSSARPESRPPLDALRRRWGLVLAAAEVAHRQGRGNAELDALANLLGMVASGLDEEAAWQSSISDPFSSSPETLAEFFKRPDSLDSPSARMFFASLRAQKVGGRDRRRRALSAILEALDVPSRESAAQRRRAIQSQTDLMDHVARLIREASAATRGLMTEQDILAELDRRRPGFGWNAPVARALSLRRTTGRPRGQTEPFQVLALRLLLEQEGSRRGVDPVRELERLKKAEKREAARRRRRGTRT